MTDVRNPLPMERQTQATNVVDKADGLALAISDDPTYERAGEFLKIVAAMRTEIVEAFQDPKRKAKAAHSAICDLERAQLQPVKDAESKLKSALGAYAAEQQRKAREEQRRLEAEARKAEEDARLAEAERLEAAGQAEEAEAVIEQEPPPPVLPAPTRAPVKKVAGISHRTTWSAECIDLVAVVKAAAAGSGTAMACLGFDQTAANSVARSLKGKVAVPGVRWIEKSGVAVGAR